MDELSVFNELDEFHETPNEKLTTDKFGRTRFEQDFFAYGSRTLFHTKGRVSVEELWLCVSAEGYCTTYFPVDGQSASTRDIQDKHPICVTIPVGKLVTSN